MKKSDLRTGMRVETNNGGLYVVLVNVVLVNSAEKELMFVSENGFLKGEFYDNDMIRDDDVLDDYTVNKVYEMSSIRTVLDSCEKGKLIWERSFTKEMTVEEIQEALGYKIKVVESKK